MYRYFLTAAAVALVLAAPVEAKRAFISYTPLQKLTRADATVVGKVSAIEKDTVNAASAPGATDKIAYKIAVIKIESGLAGAANLTHIKVGFIPPPPADPAAPPVRPGRGGFEPVHLTEGQEGLFFLTKHHSGEFYTISAPMAPTDTKAENYKGDLAEIKKGAAVLADPMKALKAEKGDDRFFAAYVLVSKYRTYPENAVEVDNVKVAAGESKLILKALAEGNWKQDRSSGNAPNSMQAFYTLGLTEKDGWKFPMVKPGEDFSEKTKEAFVAWLAGAGKDYQINKIVRKK